MADFSKKMGALWRKVSKNGNEFYSGTIDIGGTKHQVVMFPNRKREGKNDPDYNIFPSEERGHGNDATPRRGNDGWGGGGGWD